ncbi:MAG: hypothetical protein FJY82_13585 [Candidatus Aminicenantes bacterium]|nr:hypothetical protein [Candidatus Aminicenantes bacterium]
MEALLPGRKGSRPGCPGIRLSLARRARKIASRRPADPGRGGAGIPLACKTAQENFLKNGNNWIILATDGDFNVGVSSTGQDSLRTQHVGVFSGPRPGRVL